MFLTALAWSIPGQADAVPYASSLSNVDNVISFYLNQAAQRVWVVAEISGAGVVTNELGPLAAGRHSFPLRDVNWFRVNVWNRDPIGFVTPLNNHQTAGLQISADTNLLLRFSSPGGIAVDTQVEGPWFGRVYVANSVAGSVTNTLFGPERTVGDGLYALNPDLTDALGQGDEARRCGLDFMTNSDRAPYRLTAGRWGEVYVCDASETNGSLYQVDGDLSSEAGGDVLPGPSNGRFPVGLNSIHGSITAAAVTGSLVESTLNAYVIDEDLQSEPASAFRSMLNSLWRYEVWQQSPEEILPPTLLIRAPWFNLTSQVMDLSYGTNDYFYVNNYRARGDDRAGLYILGPNGEALWNSLDATRAILNQSDAVDLLVGTGGGAISPDNQLAAVMNQDTGVITVLPLREGLPDLDRRLTFTPFARTNSGACDLAFDAADNLYVISSTAQAMRVFSPGGVTTAITGSDQTFELVRPPRVSVRAATPIVLEGAVAPPTFVMQRSGDLSADLQIQFQMGGTATAGEDYVNRLPTFTAIIPAGATEIELPFPLLQDDVAESTETVTLSLLGAAEYDVGFPNAASFAIRDDEPAQLSIMTVKSNAQERFPEDGLAFDLERVGQTNSALAVHYDLSQGTAVAELDFLGPQDPPWPATIVFEPGQIRQRLEFFPRNDEEFEGSESVVLRLLPDAAYELGLPREATAWIHDDESPPLPEASVLFADNFDQDTSSNWVVRFGANNAIYDAGVHWAFDYSTLGVPPAPSAAPGTTSGLLVQLNNANSVAGGSAGINFYPKNRSFRGDFALRFEVFVHLGLTATAEHLLAGLNHSGLYTNRVTQSPDPLQTTRGGDGIWLALSSDGTDDLPCAIYTVPSPNAFPRVFTNHPATLSEAFPSPPYRRPGAPGAEGFGAGVWTEVEFSQVRDVLTVRLNNQLVFSFPNPTDLASGTFMIGWNDQLDSPGAPGLEGNYALFDNVRVLSYEPALLGISLLGTDHFALDFLAPAAASPEELEIEASPELSTARWHRVPASITQANDKFRAIVDRGDSPEFFRIQQRPR